jgi:glutamate dehydrogenase
MKEMSGASGAEVARAFWVAEGAFGLQALKSRIDALDGKTDAQVQIRLYTEIAEILRRLGLWFLSNVQVKDDLAATIALYRSGTEALRTGHKQFMSAAQQEELEGRIARFSAPGVPGDLAHDIALLPLLGVAPEIAQLARATSLDTSTVAALYFGVGAELGLDRLRLLAGRITASEHWDRLAIRRLVDDLFAAQRALSQSLLAKLAATAAPKDALAALQAWTASHAEALDRTKSFLAALETTGDLSIAKLTLANSQIHKLADI